MRLVASVLLILVVAPMLMWTPGASIAPARAGVYLEISLPDGSSYRFGPLILDRGDMVAPGFYKLVLNGSGYVEINLTPAARSVAVLARPYKTPDWNTLVSNDEALSWRLYVNKNNDHYEFMRRDNSSNAYVASDGSARDGELTWIAAYTYGDRLEIHATGSGSAPWPGNPASPASRVLIGSNMFNGSEISAQRWIGEIWAVVIHSQPGVDPRSYEVPASGLELLFDPSWYDASSNEFIAISGEGFVAGRLVGSADLEESEPRLWVVRDAYGDQYLHVSLTPYGSTLRVLDTSGHKLAEYTIIGDSRGGLVLDYPIPWPPPEGVAGSESDVLSWLAIPLVLLALAAPAIAWYSGLIGGLTASLISGVAGWLALREYSANAGADRDLWLGLGLLSIIMLILALIVSVGRALDSYSRRIRPRLLGM